MFKGKNNAEWLDQLERAAKQGQFSLQENPPQINARKKKVNCTLFNSLGMVVPVEDDIGYRPLPMTKGASFSMWNDRIIDDIEIVVDALKKACDQFCHSTSDHLAQAAEDELQHVITCIQFANDECDYGEGLEFGLDLFLYGSDKLHSRIRNLLPLAYNLLRRDLFGKILIDHLAAGRSKSIDEINELVKHQ
jgi:hypothetical protein